MVGYDRNGRSSSTNFLYGGGVVKACVLDSSNRPRGDWRELGCVDELTITLNNQTIEKYCSRTGPNVRAALDVSQVSGDLSMTMGELKFENLALFGMGETIDHTVNAIEVGDAVTSFSLWVPNPAYTGTEDTGLDPIGKSYDLFSDGSTLEAGCIDALATIARTTENRVPSTTGQTFSITEITIPGTTGGDGTSDDDWTVNSGNGIEYDAELAEFHIAGEDLLAAGLLTMAAAVGDPYIECTVTLSAAAVIAATKRDRVVALTKTSSAIALRYEGHNVRTGERVIVEMPRVSLFPNGTWNVINPADYGTLPMNGSLEANSTYSSQHGGYFHVMAL